MAEQEVGKLLGVVFHRCRLGASRDGVNGVLHRVGWQNFAIVAVEMGTVEVALQEYLHGPFAQIVAVIVASHLHQANARLSVTIFSEFDHRFNFLGRWYSHSQSKAEEYGNAALCPTLQRQFLHRDRVLLNDSARSRQRFRSGYDFALAP